MKNPDANKKQQQLKSKTEEFNKRPHAEERASKGSQAFVHRKGQGNHKPAESRGKAKK